MRNTCSYMKCSKSDPFHITYITRITPITHISYLLFIHITPLLIKRKNKPRYNKEISPASQRLLTGQPQWYFSNVGSICIYLGFPWREQFYLKYCREITLSFKHGPCPTDCLNQKKLFQKVISWQILFMCQFLSRNII